jgi:hypothetical protein
MDAALIGLSSRFSARSVLRLAVHSGINVLEPHPNFRSLQFESRSTHTRWHALIRAGHCCMFGQPK